MKEAEAAIIRFMFSRNENPAELCVVEPKSGLVRDSASARALRTCKSKGWVEYIRSDISRNGYALTESGALALSTHDQEQSA